jgi:ketoreductase
MTSTDRKKLMNKVALITGATRGIGRAIAAAYLREGACVFICARNQQEVAAAVRELREDTTDAQVDGCAGDVGKETDVCRIVDAAIEDIKPLTRSLTMQACSGHGWLSSIIQLGNGKR